MSTLTATNTDLQDAIAKLVAGYTSMGKKEWWLLEPGEPFYEDYTRFDAATGDGPQFVNFVNYFAQTGEPISAEWDDVAPKKLKRARLLHFKRTPNEMLLGRDGTIIVSAGRFGRRKKPGGGYEYLPIDEYWEWRTEVALTEPRTIENRPHWAEEVNPIGMWNVVDYATTRGDLSLKQRLEHDGKMSALQGGGYVYFTNADELREIARHALDLAELLEEPARRTVRRSAVVEENLREREQ